MSRRAPNPAADRAAQNTQTIKSLLKLEVNKSCADCKRNKHPRWASWNLGIFVCIRCSGIHRGMGTHISRVKSVDLDSWTDEQLQSVLRWGNARANKYWEAKLAPGHVPSEAKIENFIRTKYESKRWVMEGPMPDPSTLDAEGDDDVPLNIVKEKQSIERSASQRAQPSSQPTSASQIRRAPQPDLFADDSAPTGRSSSATAVAGAAPKVPPKPDAAPPKPAKPTDSLLGLDFFGAAPPPNRPASAANASSSSGQSRPDLKQSILSLYASAPRPQPQQAQHSQSDSFSAMQSPGSTQSQSSLGGFNDAFSSLSFGTPTSPPAPAPAQKPSAFAGLDGLRTHQQTPSQSTPSSAFSGGNFFDPKPAKATPAPPMQSHVMNPPSDFGAFGSATGASYNSAAKPTTSSSGLGDLFDFASSSPAPAPPKQSVTSPAAQDTSVFNLSAPQQTSAQSKPPPSSSSSANTSWAGNDPWGSSDAWGASNAAQAKPQQAAPMQSSAGDLGWGNGGSLASQSIVPGGSGGFSSGSKAAPKVAADEDFGGWSSAAPETPVAGPGQKPAQGFAASEDLFSNVWE